MEQATAQPPRATHTTVIEPAKGWRLPSLRQDLWEQRDLIYFLARRDVALRYRQSVLGAFWTLLQAVLLAAVFTVFFGILQKFDAPEGIPYSLFAVTGMMLWIFFTTALSQSSESTVTSAEVISKVYFPRLAIPIAALMPATVDFLVGFIFIIIVTIAYGFIPEVQILLMPAIVLLVLTSALGLGLWLSALNVKYRDVHVLLPFVTLVGLFISPILYPFDLITAQLHPYVQFLYEFNPMVGVLEAYRWMLLDTPFPGVRLVVLPVLVSGFLLLTGLLYFKRAEPDFADAI